MNLRRFDPAWDEADALSVFEMHVHQEALRQDDDPKIFSGSDHYIACARVLMEHLRAIRHAELRRHALDGPVWLAGPES